MVKETERVRVSLFINVSVPLKSVEKVTLIKMASEWYGSKGIIPYRMVVLHGKVSEIHNTNYKNMWWRIMSPFFCSIPDFICINSVLNTNDLRTEPL